MEKNVKEVFDRMDQKPDKNRVTKEERYKILEAILEEYPDESVTGAIQRAATSADVPYITLYHFISGRRPRRTEKINKIISAYI